MEEIKEPSNLLLSICIPTYMRADLLDISLNELLSLNNFDDQVEVVISDNASTDNTSDIVRKYQEKYPYKRIRYYRSESNIGAVENSYRVLSHGEGFYLKLFNDYICLSESSLAVMKKEVSDIIEKGISDISLNFVVGVRDKRAKKGGVFYVEDLADFVLALNNKLTWFSNFGCFKSQLPELVKCRHLDEYLLPAECWNLQIASASKYRMIVNLTSLKCLPVPNSKRDSSYNFFHVHVEYYYTIISKFVNLTHKQLRFDKKRILTDFVGDHIYEYLLVRKDCAFDLDDSKKVLYKYFKDVPYFYILIPDKFLRKAKKYFLRCLRVILYKFNFIKTVC